MHDLLVSYLLGEATEDQQRFVEQKLATEPNLRRQLDHLRHCLGLDEEAADGPEAPPADLATRTTDRVASVADSGVVAGCDHTAFSSLGFAARQAEAGQAATASYWTVADLTVATGVVLAIGMLLLPALRDSRCASRRIDCQNNLRELGVALATYSEHHDRYMPRLKPNEHAGMFSLYLLRDDFLDRKQGAHLVVCPSSSLADDIRAGRVKFVMPTWQQYQQASGPVQLRLARLTGGSYAYRLGYWDEQGQYKVLRNTYSSRVPVMADSPNADLVEYTSANHGGCGQNVLFQDQHVDYHVGCRMPEDGDDHFFLNHDGQVAPGNDRFDIVLAPSEVRPQISIGDRATRDRATRVHLRVIRANSE